MNFFELYQQEFIKFSKSQKSNKEYKKLKTRKQKTEYYLKEAGSSLKKDLEKFVKENKEIKFSSLPPEVQKFLGRDEVAKIKRTLIFDNNSVLIALSNQNFIFNERNAIFGFLQTFINNKLYLKRLFIGENIIDFDIVNNDNLEDSKEYRQIIIDLIEIYENNGAEGIETIIGNKAKIISEAVKSTLKQFSQENGDGKSAVWSLFGLYSKTKNHKGKFCLFINIEDYIDSP